MTQTSRTQPQQVHYQSIDQGAELDLRVLVGIVWRGKWLILLACLLAGVAGYLYARSLPDVYMAETALAPSDGLGGGQQDNLAGLASLAGVSLGGGGSSQTAMAEQILRSRPFLADFAERHGIEAELMAAKRWEENKRIVIFDRVTYNPDTGEWVEEPPTRVALAGRMREHMNYNQAQSGLVRLSYEHVSPEFAERVVRLMVQDLNEHIRALDIEKAESRINYLNEQIESTRLAEMQQVFFQLIESETRTIMLANVSPEYVFQAIDPAVEPDRRSQPNRMLIFVVALTAGGLFGVVVSFIMAFNRDSK